MQWSADHAQKYVEHYLTKLRGLIERGIREETKDISKLFALI